MQLIPYDYAAMAPSTDRSLAHLRPHIAALRAEGIPSILCDTGDFLQGNALADLAMQTPGVHPIIAAFNALAYDAVVLGNHDFDYGVAPLRKVLADLDCPVLAANLEATRGPPLAAPFTVVAVETEAGVLRVGLLGLTVPPSPRVARAGTDGIDRSASVATARAQIPAMRAAGADIIVALCHFGVLPSDPDENVAIAIAALPEVDAVMAGHTHDVLPGPDLDAREGVDPDGGFIHGKPAVMAGAYGRGIGVIDLTVQRGPDGWNVCEARSRVITPPPNPVPPPLSAPGLLALHEATLARLKTPVAEVPARLSTVFSMIAPDLSQQILAAAGTAQVADVLGGTTFAGVPVLGSAAPYRAGNKDAPGGFLDVPPGPVTLRDLTAIYPFQDPVLAVHRTGAQIKDWLEDAARRFATITPGRAQQPLINRAAPPYTFATLYGLRYILDPSQPVGARVRDLSFNGSPLRPDARFIVATAPSRRGIESADIVAVTPDSAQDGLRRYLRRCTGNPLTPETPWHLPELPDTAAQFVTSDAARADQAPYPVTDDGLAGPGLRQFTLTFR